MRVNEHIRYETDDRPPLLLTLGVAVQCIMLILAPTVLVVVITVKASGQDDGYLTWAIFVALIINALITAIQASRLWRLGCGQMVITGPTVQFVVVTVAAVAQGGPALLATLLVISSVFQFAVAAWLPLLRRVVTPVVTGTVLMLIAATVLPLVFDRIVDVPADAPSASGLAVALATLILATVLSLKAGGSWRLWSPLISIAVGTLIAVLFGLYSFQRVIDAAWFGFPEAQFPGFDLSFGLEFWTLLPTFVILTIVLAIKVTSDSVIIQNASQREQRAIDFRRVQGTVSANGVGMVLAGLGGVVPPTMPYSTYGLSLINLTGVAARTVGFAFALILFVMALFPKLTAFLLTIPDPVMGAYLVLLLGMYFVGGIQTAIQDGLDAQKGMVIGLSFVVGIAMHHNSAVENALGETWGSLLGNGVMAGMVVAIVLTTFIELTGPRSRRLEVELDFSALPRIDEFLGNIASDLEWNEESTLRLRSAGEETLSSLMMSSDDEPPRLRVSASPSQGLVELEFVASVEDHGNIQDRLAYLGDQTEIPDPSEVSFRLLRHYASSVQHRKYHGLDVVTVQVEGSR